MIAGHSISESVFRPARLALTADTAIGDSLPRSHPTFASRSNTSMVAVAFSFALAGAMLAIIVSRFNDAPVIAAVIAGVLAASFAVPISVGLGFSTSLQPIRDLARGAERVAAGDYNQRLPVVQDDDLGALAASFNRMQAGLAERRRLHAAFGTYVVIAGTIGGGGKLEFTLIGDAVNVAARVEQLTKTTGDTILLTQQCLDALGSRPPGLLDRGAHALKGKSAAVQVYSLAGRHRLPGMPSTGP